MFREACCGRGALLSQFHLPPLDATPLLYIYGTSKNTNFHTEHGLAALDAAPGCSHVGIARAGHWVYLQQEARCLALVRDFLGRDGATPAAPAAETAAVAKTTAAAAAKTKNK